MNITYLTNVILFILSPEYIAKCFITFPNLTNIPEDEESDSLVKLGCDFLLNRFYANKEKRRLPLKLWLKMISACKRLFNVDYSEVLGANFYLIEDYTDDAEQVEIKWFPKFMPFDISIFLNGCPDGDEDDLKGHIAFASALKVNKITALSAGDRLSLLDGATYSKKILVPNLGNSFRKQNQLTETAVAKEEVKPEYPVFVHQRFSTAVAALFVHSGLEVKEEKTTVRLDSMFKRRSYLPVNHMQPVWNHRKLTNKVRR